MTKDQIERIKDMPSIEEVLKMDSTPTWVKELIKTALRKDCVDAANCLELVSQLFTRRCDIMLRGDRSPFYKPGSVYDAVPLANEDEPLFKHRDVTAEDIKFIRDCNKLKKTYDDK